MQSQMQNMDPGMMQAAMAQMNSMSAADKARVREQMQSMGPGQLPSIGNASASISQLQARQNYEYQVNADLGRIDHFPSLLAFSSAFCPFCFKPPLPLLPIT